MRLKIKNIPFINLKCQHRKLSRGISRALQDVIAQSAFVQGPQIETFERNFAAYCGCTHAVGCSSGTAALHLAMVALGIGKGDEVITSPQTFVATLEAIVHAGAKPVLVDIDARTYNLDPRKIEAAITKKTKAVIPVHMYGHPCHMEAIKQIAGKHHLLIIEDCAQAHGAKFKNQPVGSWGDVGCFSFYPSKNLGAMGDAGALVTRNAKVASRAKKLRDHGRNHHCEHDCIGFNYRLDGLQATVLDLKLKYLEQWNQARNERAGQYLNGLKSLEALSLPRVADHAQHVYHLFVVRTKARDQLKDYLRRHGVQSAVHYPTPVHLQPGYRFLNYHAGDFPQAEAAAKQVLSLPMYPELSPAEIQYICRVIKEFFSG